MFRELTSMSVLTLMQLDCSALWEVCALLNAIFHVIGSDVVLGQRKLGRILKKDLKSNATLFPSFLPKRH